MVITLDEERIMPGSVTLLAAAPEGEGSNLAALLALDLVPFRRGTFFCKLRGISRCLLGVTLLDTI